METLVNKILKILKARVKQNVKEIQYIQDEIVILQSEPSSTFTVRELELKNELNKELHGENEDFIEIQLQLSEFMDKYGDLFNSEEKEIKPSEKKEPDNSNFFKKTVTGEMQFDPEHPQFNNPKFLNDLLEYYQGKEDYEKCHELIKLKGGKKTV